MDIVERSLKHRHRLARCDVERWDEIRSTKHRREASPPLRSESGGWLDTRSMEGRDCAGNEARCNAHERRTHEYLRRQDRRPALVDRHGKERGQPGDKTA